MNRKEFIKIGGFSCLGLTVCSLLLQGCVGSKLISVQILGENIVVPIKDFEMTKNGEKSFKKYIIAQNDLLKFPICVYRFSDNDFKALYMQCTHQGAELNAYEDKLVCSAHGSEFDTNGNATNSPAFSPLKSFNVQIENQNLLISLKATS